VSNPSDGETWAGESLAKIKARRVSFDISAKRDNDFFHRFGRKTFLKCPDAEIFRLDAIQGRDFAAQDVVFSTECARFFDAYYIDGPLNDANERSVASRIGTDVAWGVFGQGAADLAEFDALTGIQNGLSELLNGARFGLDQVQRNALCGARADAGQFVQGSNQRFNGCRQSGHLLNR
jgi:hypothetical protein